MRTCTPETPAGIKANHSKACSPKKLVKAHVLHVKPQIKTYVQFAIVNLSTLSMSSVQGNVSGIKEASWSLEHPKIKVALCEVKIQHTFNQNLWNE